MTGIVKNKGLHRSRALLAAGLGACLGLCTARAGAIELEPIQVKEELERRPGTTQQETQTDTSSQTIYVDSERSAGVSATLVRSPAVSFRKWGNDEASQMLSLRGQDPSQTLLSLNGFPLGGGASSGLDTRWVQPRWLQSVQIYPNGEPSRLWQESLGGAVDMRQDLESPGSSSVTALGGSFGMRGLGAHVRRGNYSLGVDVRAANDDFSYQDSGGTLWNPEDDQTAVRNHNRWWRASVLPSISTRVLGMRASAFWLGGWEKRELPGAVGTLGEQEWGEQLHLVGATLEDPRGFWSARAFARYRENRLQSPADSRASSFAGVPGQSREVAAGGQIAGSTELISSLRLRTTVSGSQESLENQITAGTFQSVSGRKTLLTVAPAAEWRRAMMVSLAVPIESDFFSPIQGVFGYAEQPQKAFTLISPRIGALLPVARGLQARLGAGRYQRSPGLYELYGDSRGLVPNPKLQPESALKAEAGVDWTHSIEGVILSLSATSSWSENENLLIRASHGPGSTIVSNVGQSRILAQELALQMTHPRGWFIQGLAQVLATENRGGVAYYSQKALPYRPPLRLSVDLERRFAKWSLGYLWQWQSAFFADQANLQRIDSFGEHSLRGSYLSRTWGALQVEWNNIFDVTVVGAEILGLRTRGSPSGLAGYPYPGRRIYLTWSYLW